ncbi:MAG TPA: DEAD/DEAH box helicase [Myxococcales bacterium]|jgi:ATP-dependent RNA helicase DeaD
MDFASLQPHPTLLAALAERGYEQPTPVQALVLAPEHAGRDLLVSAQTGSGKTAAFGLALAKEILGDAETLPRATLPLALVVAPTRELALQVQEELRWLYSKAGVRITACVGGMDPRREQRALRDGAHLVVGTPGRLCDHLDRKNLKLSALRAVVLDEADEMLDMGFREDLERILRDAPAGRRTLMLSATMPHEIEQLARKYQKDAVRLAASPPRAAHQDIEYRAHAYAPREREHAVVNTLRALDPPGALVFCATREGVNHLSANLVERGFAAVAISGELTQPERLRALQSLRDGRARVLVATDVAARGLDLPALDLVIQADLPNDARVLQHRSGRTGRAGRKGVSVVLVPNPLRSVADRMFRAAGIKPTWAPIAKAEDIRVLDQKRLVEGIVGLCAETSEEDLEVARSLLSQQEAEKLVAALVRSQRARLPAPEELPQTTGMRDPSARPARHHGHAAEEPTFRPGFGMPARDHHGSRGPQPRHDEPTEGVWFRLNVGRLNNADPKWLVPLICRRGGTVKADIGKIVIMPKETRFLVRSALAEQFEKSAGRPDKKDPAVKFQRLTGVKKAQ